MKLFHHKISSKWFTLSVAKGFTLIELLVVIGILGILAAALIATIDPIEQLKKAQDTTSKGVAREFVAASTRYYSTHQNMAWNANPTVASCGTAPTVGPGVNLAANSVSGCLNALVTDGELKPAFTSATANLSQVTINGNASAVTACFLPTSKAQRSDPNSKYDVNGNPLGAGCPGGSTCYWCVY